MFICTYALHIAFYACFPFQIHRYTWYTVIFLISLMLLVIACTCMPEPHHLIMYTCAWYARHLALSYVLTGLHLTTMNSHIQILETGPWWPCYSWSVCAANPSVTIRVQQKLGSLRGSSSQFLSCLAPESLLLLVSTSPLIMYISSCIVLLYFLVI